MITVKATVDELRPIDDTFMKKLAEDRLFCEELLQVVLDNSYLRVVSNKPQKDIHNADTRSVTVDILCEDETGTQFSVEVQKADDDDHQKRVRYNGSCVQILSLKKGEPFKNLPDVYMIYISEKDFFKRNQTIYHIDRVIRETGETINNGYHEVYVNAEIDDGTSLAEYMKIINNSQVKSNPKFPNTCSVIRYFKEGEGRSNMCEVVERYAREYAREQAIEAAISLIMDGVSDSIIQNATKLSLEKITEIREEYAS